MLYMTYNKGVIKMYNIILFEKNNKCPVADFLDKLIEKISSKIHRNIELLEKYGTYIGEPFVKHIEKDIWELRTDFSNIRTRIFFIVNGETIILLHGFIKKTNKAPKKEIEIAKNRMKEYFN